jgi:hypothetical protein
METRTDAEWKRMHRLPCVALIVLGAFLFAARPTLGLLLRGEIRHDGLGHNSGQVAIVQPGEILGTFVDGTLNSDCGRRSRCWIPCAQSDYWLKTVGEAMTEALMDGKANEGIN